MCRFLYILSTAHCDTETSQRPKRLTLFLNNLFHLIYPQHISNKWLFIKGKGLPQKAEVAQGVPGRLRPRIFLTFGTTVVVGRQPYAPATFTPRRNPWYSFLEAESTPEHMVLSVTTKKKSAVTPPGIDAGTVRLVAQCLNHYAIQGPFVHHQEVISEDTA